MRAEISLDHNVIQMTSILKLKATDEIFFRNPERYGQGDHVLSLCINYSWIALHLPRDRREQTTRTTFHTI